MNQLGDLISLMAVRTLKTVPVGCGTQKYYA
jgi:hypothetical protein